jgi:uncharacterized protein YndB with AHSA1/START domain
MTTKNKPVELHRVLRASAASVYKAFVDPDALARWLPPYGYLGKVHEMDARVGGGYRMSFTEFGSGQTHTFTADFTELVPGEKICRSERFDDPNLPGEMEVTITLREFECGTDLRITQAGIPDIIPADSCYLGWQESLLQLAKLVESHPHGVD